MSHIKIHEAHFAPEMALVIFDDELFVSEMVLVNI